MLQFCSAADAFHRQVCLCCPGGLCGFGPGCAGELRCIAAGDPHRGAPQMRFRCPLVAQICCCRNSHAAVVLLTSSMACPSLKHAGEFSPASLLSAHASCSSCFVRTEHFNFHRSHFASSMAYQGGCALSDLKAPASLLGVAIAACSHLSLFAKSKSTVTVSLACPRINKFLALGKDDLEPPVFQIGVMLCVLCILLWSLCVYKDRRLALHR